MKKFTILLTSIIIISTVSVNVKANAKESNLPYENKIVKAIEEAKVMAVGVGGGAATAGPGAIAGLCVWRNFLGNW